MGVNERGARGRRERVPPVSAVAADALSGGVTGEARARCERNDVVLATVRKLGNLEGVVLLLMPVAVAVGEGSMLDILLALRALLSRAAL